MDLSALFSLANKVAIITGSSRGIGRAIALSLVPVLIKHKIGGGIDVETAVMALQRGAYDFIEKPFKSDRLVVVVQRALEASSLKRENKRLRAQVAAPSGFIGRSAAAQTLHQTHRFARLCLKQSLHK